MGKDGKAKVGLKKKKIGQEETIAILEDILRSFKAGKMVIQNDEESVTLTPSDGINIKIKAKTQKLKNKLSMELSWKTAPIEADDFTITEPVDVTEAEMESEPETPVTDISNKAKVIKKAEQ